MTEIYTATLDRIVDGQTAVLLLEEDGETVDQLNVDVARLPSESQHEGRFSRLSLKRANSVKLNTSLRSHSLAKRLHKDASIGCRRDCPGKTESEVM